MKAVGKVLQLEKIQQASPENNGVNGTLSDESPFIYIKSERQFIKILPDDILFIESIKNHVKIITRKEILITLMSISEMEEKLPPQRFLRIHRSYISSVSKIEKFTHASVTMGKQELPVGEFYKTEVLKRLNQNLI
ncbi:MAG: LytR/AlgR family response regulator transcription factor [Sphingobacteriales bacterium]